MMNYFSRLTVVLLMAFTAGACATEFNYSSKYSSMNLDILNYKYMKRDSSPIVLLTNYDSVLQDQVCIKCSSFKTFGFTIPTTEIDNISSWQDGTAHYFLKKNFISSYRDKQVKLYFIEVLEKWKNKERKDLSFIYTKEFGIVAYKSFEYNENIITTYSYFLMSELGLGALLKN